MKKIMGTFAFLTSILALTACGGGSGGGGSAGISYDGTTTAAKIDSANAGTLSKTTSLAIESAAEQNAANGANPFAVIANTSVKPPVDPQILINIAKNIQTPNVPVAATYTAAQLNSQLSSSYFCGGSVSIPDSWTSSSSSYLNGTMTVNNLCYNDGVNGQIVMNGSIIFTEDASSFGLQYSNFTATYGGETYTFNMTLSCDSSGYNCSYSSDFVGSDGRTYRVSDFSVSGTPTVSGVYFSGTVYDPDHGYVTVSMSNPVIFSDCSGTILPTSGGPVTITSGSDSAVISFNGCTSFDVSVNGGSAITVNW